MNIKLENEDKELKRSFEFSHDMIYEILLSYKVKKGEAMEIADYVAKGKPKIHKDGEKWKEYIIKNNLPEEFIKIAESIKYLCYRDSCIAEVILSQMS